MAKSFTISMIVDMVNKASGPAAAVVRSLNGIDAKTKAVAKSLAQMGTRMQETGKRMMGSFGGTAALIAPVAGALKIASTWEDSLAKISTMTQMTTAQVRARWQKDFFAIARETGANLTDIGEAAYQALSAAVPEDKLAGFLRTAVLASKVGFTSTTNAVDGMTSAMNAFGISAEQAGNLMMSAQIKGKTTINDISQNIGQLGPIAANMGMSFNEVMAALAGMTQTGSRTEAAMTGIRSIMTALAKQTDQQKEALNKLGIEFSADTIRQYGFIKSMQVLDTAVRKNTKTEGERAAVLNDVFGRVEGLNAAFALLSGKGLQVYNETMKMGIEDTKLMERAQEQMGGKASTAWRQMKNELQIFMIEIGSGLLPALKDAIAGFINVFGAVRDVVGESEVLREILKTLGIAIFGIIGTVKFAGAAMWAYGTAVKFVSIVMGVFSGVITALKFVVVAFNAVFLASPIGWIALAIGAAIGAIILMIRHWDKVKAALVGAGRAVGGFFGSIGRGIANGIRAFFGFFRSIGEGIANAGKALGNFVLSLGSSIGNGIINVFNSIVSFFKELPGKMLDLGIKAGKALFNGIKKGAGKMWRWALDVTGIDADSTGGTQENARDFLGSRGFRIPEATRPVGNNVTVDQRGMVVQVQDGTDFARKTARTLQPTFEQQLDKTQANKSRRKMEQ